MSQAKIIREEITEADITYSATLIKLMNACIVLLSEGEENLGTLAASMAQRPGRVGPPLSSILLGERSTTITRLLAERLAANMKSMVLVSVFMKSLDEKKAARVFLRLLEKILKEKIPKNEP